MFGSRTRNRISLAFTAALATLLTLVLVAQDLASAGHPRRGAKTSLVADAFGDPSASPPVPPPPPAITCEWYHDPPRDVISYVCFGHGFAQQLTAPDLSDDGDLLRKGGNPPEYAVAEVDEFSCTRPANATDVQPSDYTCSYRHRHDGNRHTHMFTMHEMVYMTDPADPQEGPQVEYALPPHK